MPDRAVVLLSGGLDSATAAAFARRDGYDCHALSVIYGQRHAAEIEASIRVAEHLGMQEHLRVSVDLGLFGGSALTGDGSIPKGRTPAEMTEDIPTTYVPARNTILLSLALAWSEALAARVIYIGVNALDYSGYPDCRPEFISAFSDLARLATKAGVEGAPTRIHAPLISFSKAEIIQAGQRLGVDYGLTLSCYDPDPAGAACGDCDSCRLRRKGFADARVTDPTRYSS